MAGSPAIVKEFIEETHEQIRPAARDEMYEMEKIKVLSISFYQPFNVYLSVWYSKAQSIEINEKIILTQFNLII